ncbi:MAG: exodeoxyribonuclease V subunit gamma [Azoarcus sp.]|jgi:exodeoxyribonuclease V gamma subunit|nr:exodeoxyribonuclease V subunit gamma [Azoarcus sp.]
MFSVVFSNRCEHLLEALLARLDADRRGPFARRQVVAPGSALRRRIELAVADREGVCAGIDFDHLAQWLWRRIGHVVDLPARTPYAPPALAWRIFAALDAPWVRGHERLARYLREADARMRFDLSERLAHLFDHYLCYRPDWLERWADGERALPAEDTAGHADEDWQAELWRRIHGGSESGDDDGGALSSPFMRFLHQAARMDDAALATAGLPPAVHIFGLPALPPLYLEILRTLARAMDVHMYVLNPCREYWFDIIDARRLSWLSKRQQDLFFETGNKLLAAWGKQAQVHIESLFEGEHPMREEAAFAAHPARHLLAKLQNAILDLHDLEAGSIRLDGNDRSIELHICHSRTRELEALHDRLLSLFSAPRPPRPDEIVVLTPDLAACAPLIEAVFGAAPRERHIPWRIAGASAAASNPVARVLDWLLTLAAGRAPASRVFDLLQQPLVAAHFGLDEAGLEQVCIWMESAGIRWGLDAEHVGEGSGAHTMEKGLARLFLSWAAGEAASRALFAGHAGAAHAPRGSAGLALGAFWRYAGTLRRLRAELLEPRDAESWRALLMGALAALTGEAPDHAEEMRGVRETIAALAEDMKTGSGAESAAMIPLDVVHPALAARFGENVHSGTPGGAVTFGALPSLRGLPYRMVCVIGLDHDVFPGREHNSEFDLMALHPRKGDRQRRIDERNLFLDVLLAARDVLHLSCVGRSARDNTALPPSPLVDELLDTLAAACAEDPEQPASLVRARARLTVLHPLQAFSPGYFTPDKEDRRLENFRDELAAALAARQRPPPKRAAAAAIEARGDDDEDGRKDVDGNSSGDSPFFTALLPPPEERWRQVDLVQFERFFANPCRFLLRERLGLNLFAAQDDLADVETFVPDWQARNALAERLLPVLLAGKGADGDNSLLALARAGGEYPDGSLGDSALRRELAALRAFAGRVKAARMRPCLPACLVKLDFDLGGEFWSLQTVFNDLRADGLVHHRYDKARARDYLAAWIDHLALCAVAPDGVECRSVGLSRDESFTLRPLPAAAARQHLARLLELYRDGLREPLRFFPKSAWEYARRLAPDSDDRTARAEAARTWAGGDFPERNDFAYRLALRGVDDEALDGKFWRNAETVFGPLRAALDDSRSAWHPG